jgi:hypothetical protein
LAALAGDCSPTLFAVAVYHIRENSGITDAEADFFGEGSPPDLLITSIRPIISSPAVNGMAIIFLMTTPDWESIWL